MIRRNEHSGETTYEDPFGKTYSPLKISFNKYLFLERWYQSGWDWKIYWYLKKHNYLEKQETKGNKHVC